MDLHENLARYLEIETILNRMFHDFGYCLAQCIEKKDNGHAIHCGCCKDTYYKKFDQPHPVFDLLKKEREILYGRPEAGRYVKRISPCEYHTLNGCLLLTHKSPVCLGFLCRESIEVLRSCYGIMEYDYLGISHALEWILTNDLSGRSYHDFRDSCLNMAEKVSASGMFRRN